MTATPAINSPNLIFSLNNLLLPEDRQMDTNINPDHMIKESIMPYFKNIISYIRSFDTGVDIKYRGYRIKYNHAALGKIIPSQQIVWPVIMPPYQMSYYNEYIGNTNDIYNKQRNASLLVYENGIIQTKGFESHFQPYNLTNLIQPKNLYDNTVSTEEHFNRDNLKNRYSGKIAEILEIVENSTGNCYVYYDFKESGVFPTAYAFMLDGYELLNPKDPVFLDDETTELSLCSSQDKKITIPPNKRVAIFVPENGERNNRKILDLFNHYDNRHGQYIKVIITSPIGREGINTRNVTTFILAQPLWNQAAAYQALSRSIRAGSHDDLIHELSRRIDVNIYQLASVSNIDDLDLSHKSETWCRSNISKFDDDDEITGAR